MSGSKNDSGPLVVGGPPRIDFLPTETKKRKENRRQRRSFVALAIMVAVVCALGVVFSSSLALASQTALEAERNKTAALLAEQRNYAEARSVAADLQAATDARLVGSATEIMWSDYFLKIIDVIPEGSRFLNVSAKGLSALDLTGAPDILLQEPRVAQLLFQVDSVSLASADATVLAIRKLHAFADATAYTITYNADTALYRVAITLDLDVAVFERRFLTPLPDDPDAEAPTEEPTPTPTPTPTSTSTSTPSPTPTNETEG